MRLNIIARSISVGLRKGKNEALRRGLRGYFATARNAKSAFAVVPPSPGTIFSSQPQIVGKLAVTSKTVRSAGQRQRYPGRKQANEARIDTTENQESRSGDAPRFRKLSTRPSSCVLLGFRRGSCSDPTGEDRGTEQVSMSQKKPEFIQLTPSPPATQASITVSQGRSARSANDAFWKPPPSPVSTTSASTTKDAPRPILPRSLAIQGLINPSDPRQENERPLRSPTASQSASYVQKEPSNSSSSLHPSSGHPGAFSNSFTEHAATSYKPSAIQQSIIPQHRSSDFYPLPDVQGPRRVLTPQFSHVSRSGWGNMNIEHWNRQANLQPAPPASKRRFQEYSEDLAKPPRAGSVVPASGPSFSHVSLAPNRSLSQPILTHPWPGNSLASVPRLTTFSSPQGLSKGAQGQQHGQVTDPHVPPTRSPSASVITGPSQTAGGTELYRLMTSYAASNNIDGKTKIGMAGGNGAGSIEITLDSHHASRQANAKRQRNKEASARFRGKKAQEKLRIEQENKALSAENQELKERMRSLVPPGIVTSSPTVPSLHREVPVAPSNPAKLTASTLPEAQSYAFMASQDDKPGSARRSREPPKVDTPTYLHLPPPVAKYTPTRSSAHDISPGPREIRPSVNHGERLPPLKMMESAPGSLAQPQPTIGQSRLDHDYIGVPYENARASLASEPRPAFRWDDSNSGLHAPTHSPWSGRPS